MEKNPWGFFKEELSQEIERCLRYSSELQVNKSRSMVFEKLDWKKQKNCIYYAAYLVFCMLLARQPPVDLGLLIHEVSRSRTTTHHSG